MELNPKRDRTNKTTMAPFFVFSLSYVFKDMELVLKVRNENATVIGKWQATAACPTARQLPDTKKVREEVLGRVLSIHRQGDKAPIGIKKDAL